MGGGGRTAQAGNDSSNFSPISSYARKTPSPPLEVKTERPDRMATY